MSGGVYVVRFLRGSQREVVARTPGEVLGDALQERLRREGPEAVAAAIDGMVASGRLTLEGAKRARLRLGLVVPEDEWSDEPTDPDIQVQHLG